MVCQEWNRLGDRIVRFRNVELVYFIFLIWTSLCIHRYHALPLATICMTSRQSIRGWHSSNMDVVPRYFATRRRGGFLFFRAIEGGRFWSRLTLSVRYSPLFVRAIEVGRFWLAVTLALSVCYGFSLYALLLIARTKRSRSSAVVLSVGRLKLSEIWTLRDVIFEPREE